MPAGASGGYVSFSLPSGVSLRSVVTSDSRSDGPYRDAVQELLADAVKDELGVMSVSNVVRSATGEVVQLPQEVLDNLASAVASRIDYAFAFRWEPRWVGRGQPHVWSEADGWYVRCTPCLAVSGPLASEQDAHAWHDAHSTSSHGR